MLIPSEAVEFRIHCSRSEAVRRLDRHLIHLSSPQLLVTNDPGGVFGVVTRQKLVLDKVPANSGMNSWRPQLKARFKRRGDEWRLCGRFRITPWVLAFTLFMMVSFAGMGVFVLYLAVWAEAEKSPPLIMALHPWALGFAVWLMMRLAWNRDYRVTHELRRFVRQAIGEDDCFQIK